MKLKAINFLIIIVLLVACGPPSDEKDSGKHVFKYNESAGISSLDPAFARSLEGIWAMNQIYNGLVQMDDNMQILPCLAKSWEISDSGRTYTFHLRNDVLFHDHELFENGKGRKVIASDFVHSFFRIIDPEIASPGAYIFQNIDRSEKSNYLGFVAENDTTLKIFLQKPFPPFLGILSMQYCSVIPHEIVEHYGKDFRNNPVGTGPFQFKKWKEGVKLVFVKNNNYFEKENGVTLPYLDAVSISFAKDRQAAFLDFKKGIYDMLSGLEGVYKDEILTQTGDMNPIFDKYCVMQKQAFLKTDYLGILIENKKNTINPLKEKAIRQAINYGFDRQKMVKYLRNNIGKPATSGFVPIGLPSFDASKVKGYDYNPKKAKELLLHAGFPEGEGLPPITITTTVGYRDLCEFIQSELTQIGMDIKIDVIDEATFREMVAQSKVNIFRKSWIADYPDAENFLALFYSKNFSPIGPNYTHFYNKEVDDLYEKSQQEVNDSARYAIYREMDRIIIEEAPVVPLYYDEVVRFVKKDIIGLGSNPMNLLVLKRVKKN